MLFPPMRRLYAPAATTEAANEMPLSGCGGARATFDCDSYTAAAVRSSGGLCGNFRYLVRGSATLGAAVRSRAQVIPAGAAVPGKLTRAAGATREHGGDD